jgi:hypothetical protein
LYRIKGLFKTLSILNEFSTNYFFYSVTNLWFIQTFLNIKPFGTGS